MRCESKKEGEGVVHTKGKDGEVEKEGESMRWGRKGRIRNNTSVKEDERAKEETNHLRLRE